MSEVSNPNLNVTRQDLADFYDKIFPYLGGRANAGFTPVGTLIGLMGVTAPANYLACDGTVYNISDYPELATYFGQQFSMVNKFGGDGTTTFAVPDLRGEFLRGTGANSHTNQGNGAAVGTHQDATAIPSIATWASQVGILAPYNENNIDVNADSSYGSSATNKYWKQMTIAQTAASSGQDLHSVRPTNTSVLWCIATKNIYMNPSLDYSTDEKVVGSYVDGKTVYQKTIITESLTLTASASTYWNLWIASPINTLVSYEGFFKYSTSNDIYRIGEVIFNEADTTTVIKSHMLKLSGGTLRAKFRNPSSSAITLYNLYATIRYTKTTD